MCLICCLIYFSRIYCLEYILHTFSHLHNQKNSNELKALLWDWMHYFPSQLFLHNSHHWKFAPFHFIPVSCSHPHLILYITFQFIETSFHSFLPNTGIKFSGVHPELLHASLILNQIMQNLYIIHHKITMMLALNLVGPILYQTQDCKCKTMFNWWAYVLLLYQWVIK